MSQTSGWIIGAFAGVSLGAHGAARPVVNDIEFVTVGALGNAGYPLQSPAGYINIQGRGAVDYEYRIGKYEVTTAQWMEFVNNYSTLGGSWTFFAAPTFWGAVQDPGYSGPGVRWILNPSQPSAAMRPVYGITWREAAMFCNWMHNDKVPTLAAIADGAYDTSLFTTNPNGTFNDQLTHHPGAKYWIPTFDEWIKAGHYDPNRYGPGQGGWWEYPTKSDEPPIGGVPGVGQTNAGFSLPGFGAYQIPLGSYPETLSPWGALDMSGMATEATEFYWPLRAPTERGSKGSVATLSPAIFDRIYMFGAFLRPGAASDRLGLRVATSIPGPAGGSVLVLAWLHISKRRRRTPWRQADGVS